MNTHCKNSKEQPKLSDRLENVLSPAVREFHRTAIMIAQESGIPFLLGGAYGLMAYTGIVRTTKDLDIFVSPKDLGRILELYSSAGFRTEITDKRWLAKVFSGDNFIDIIHASMNTLSEVDDMWFDRAVEREALGLNIKVCPVEEMIFTKAFVMDRERYDGADIAHLLVVCGNEIDWHHLLYRFGPCWSVLLSHLLLFTFVYPSERSNIPNDIMKELLDRAQSELDTDPPSERICRGALFSGTQYAVDVEHWAFDVKSSVE